MRETLNPERSRSVGLKEWFRTRGIELVLCDLDDTLINTHLVFIEATQKFFDRAKAEIPSLNEEDFLATFSNLEKKYFFSCVVNPVRYTFIVEELAEIYRPSCGEIGQVLRTGLPILENIYQTVPKFFPDAEESLKEVKAAGVAMGLVTHGNLSWSNLKIKELDLRRFFSHFWIADEDEFKTSRDWQSALTGQFGVKPEKTLVVGDNVKGDIRAADEIGIRCKVLIPSPWSVYTEGEIPKGTLVVPKIGQLVDFLLDSQ